MYLKCLFFGVPWCAFKPYRIRGDKDNEKSNFQCCIGRFNYSRRADSVDLHLKPTRRALNVPMQVVNVGSVRFEGDAVGDTHGLAIQLVRFTHGVAPLLWSWVCGMTFLPSSTAVRAGQQ